ncbi:Ig-like domain-containing protein [Halalkalirubrum salinum]|uniref:Ig-like domain-containing protein n=1 Tax=Halalkalirubrum salinum TaxID=2563889 RepID=UPI0010FB77E8|nr:Ig-like domain-containing protein [Halalkalirubrum salinum]
MRSIGDDRGQSIQVGAVLIFGIIIVFLAIWQAQVIPAENAEVEFQHSLDAQEDMQQLRSELRSVAGNGASRSTTIELGTRYPTRVAFVNPPPATGSLSTTEGTVSIENASSGVTNGFWNGTTRNYTTNTIAYEPSYSEYNTPPRTVYEHGFLYNEFDREGTQLAESAQPLVRTSGNTTTIDLFALRGSIDADGVERESIDLYPNSAGTRTVPVTASSDGEPITITIPTRNQAMWNEVFEEVGEETITEITNVSDSQVRIELNSTNDMSYRLRMAEVGLAEEDSQEPAYIVPVGSENVSQGEEITAEVRDRYNNPIEDVRVSVNSSARIEGDENETTDSSGQVRFTVADDAEEGAIELSIDSAIDCDGCGTVRYDVEERTSGDSRDDNDGSSDINPEDPGRYQLVYNRTEVTGNGNNRNVSVYLDNPAAVDPNVSTTITIDSVRLPFYYSGQGTGNDPARDATLTFRDVNTSNTTTISLNSIPNSKSTEIDVTGNYLRVEFDFDNDPRGDFFIFSLRSETEVSTFYIAVPS